MKKILLIGYARENLGDDLFFNLLISRYEEYNIDFYCPKKYSHAFLKAKNLKLIPGDFFKNDNIKLDEYAICIYIGGSIFKESTYDFEVKEWLNNFVLNCKKKNIPFYFISSNFGPYQTKGYYDLCKNIIKNSTCINFRETYSYNLFNKLDNSKYIPDVVFSMDYDKKDTKEGTIGISLINLYGILRNELNNSYFEYMKFLKNNIENYIKEGKKVYLFSFCSREKDDIAINTLMSYIDIKYHKSIKVINYNGNLKKFLDIFGSMEYLLCTRFHAMILGAYFNQKIYVCSYSDKLTNVIDDYKLDCQCIKIDKNIENKVLDLKDYKICKNVNKLKKLSKDNYIDLDKKINELFKSDVTYSSSFKDYYSNGKSIKKSVKNVTKKVLKKVKIIKSKPKEKKDINIELNNKLLLNSLLKNNTINENTNINILNYLGYENKKIKIEEINNGPLVSIIIPTYKRDDYLFECVDSLLNQSYKNIEIVIVDDYVNSNTKEKIEKKYKNYKNIKYLKNKVNSKAGKSRQNGYNNISGKYVIYCDDDDVYIDYNFIKISVDLFEEDKDINIIGFNSFTYYEDKKELKFKPVNYNETCNSLDYVVSFQINHYKPCPSFTIFRKNILDKYDFKNMEMMNDSSIFLNAMQEGKMKIFNNPIGLYRQHSANITLNLTPEFIIQNMEEKKKVYERLKKNNSIPNPDYWWYQQNKLTFEYFVKGTKPSFKNFNKMLKWSFKNVGAYRYKLSYEMIKEEAKTKVRKQK